MNKIDIIDAISEAANISKKDATVAADTFIDKMVEALKDKDSVNLSGFGVLQSVYRAERKGHNPHTKQPMTIPASYALKFKPAKKLKEAINEVVA